MKFDVNGNFCIRHNRKMIKLNKGEQFETTDKELIEKLNKAKLAKETKAK